MTRSRIIAWITAVAILAILVVIAAALMRARPRPRPEISAPAAPSPEITRATPPPSPSAAAPASPVAKATDISSLAPSASQLREEVKAQPHSPPASLLEFAQRVGSRMDEALPDSARSSELMRELGSCATRPDVPATVEAICLNNAQRLSQAHEELRPEYERMRDQASPEAARALRLFQPHG